MKVNELAEIICRYPPDMEVRVTWESTVHEIDPAFIYQGPIREGCGVISSSPEERGEGCLLIDADYHDLGSYKPDDAIQLHLKGK